MYLLFRERNLATSLTSVRRKRGRVCRGEGFCREKGFFVSKRTEVLAHLREILSAQKKCFIWMCEGNGMSSWVNNSSAVRGSAADNLVAGWCKVLHDTDLWKA